MADNIDMAMANPSASILDRVLAGLPGWMLLGAAASLAAMIMLVPPWLSLDRLTWERELMQIQAERIEREKANYQAFYQALKEEDPVLLERLAYAQLRYKPPDKDPVPVGPASGRGGRSTLAESGLIERWLKVDKPRLGQDMEPYHRPRTLMVRLATGDSRFVLLAAALSCGLAGLWWPQRTEAKGASRVAPEPPLPERPSP